MSCMTKLDSNHMLSFIKKTELKILHTQKKKSIYISEVYEKRVNQHKIGSFVYIYIAVVIKS